MIKLIKSRIHYWNCSKFADLIRGVKKPYALEWNKWDEWKNEQKKQRPWRLWLSDTVLKRLQDIVNFPSDLYYTIKVYIRNRYIDKLHYLHSDLIPGEYYDLDTRILHSLFTELKDLVEVEYAHIMKSSKDSANYVFKKGRCPLAGLDYLNWAGQLKYNEDYGITLGDKHYDQLTEQAKTAQKVLELYNWWKNRPNRLDPYSIFSKEKDGKFYYRKIHKMEESYEKEDTKMLVELVKIRGGLWT